MALQFPDFYKPDPNNPQVYDINNNPITLDQYLAATGQVGVDPKRVDWSFVKPISPAQAQAQKTLIDSGFTQEELAAIPPQYQTAFAAFMDVQNEAYSKGGIGEQNLNEQTLQDALAKAAKNPQINQKYGEELITSTQNLQQNIGLLTGQYTEDQVKQMRDFEDQKKALAEQYAAAGMANSGFRQKAKQNLEADQNNIISSSRRQLQQNLTGITAPFEQRFGTEKLKEVLGTNAPGVAGEASYKPYGGTTPLQGSYGFEKENAIKQRAQDSYLTVNPTQ
jgi:hypothetical protein